MGQTEPQEHFSYTVMDVLMSGKCVCHESQEGSGTTVNWETGRLKGKNSR